VINSLKHLASRFPKSLQQELKRLHYWRQIASNNFISEEPEWKMLDKYVSSGDMAIDIGANVGHYTARLSDIVGPNGRVIAVEPIPQTFDLLSSNVAHFTYNNVSLLNFAISDCCTCVAFEVPKFKTGLDNYYQAYISDKISTNLKILCIDIDSFPFRSKVSFMKIDAEGHDFRVLKGGKNLVAKYKPTIIVEGHDPQILEMLKQLGYSSKNLPGSPNTIFKIN